MKKYTITLNLEIETENADYDQISEFGENFIENIMGDDDLIFGNDIEITDISLHDIEDHNYDQEDNMYLQDEDE